MKTFSFFFIFLYSLLISIQSTAQNAAIKGNRPNIILILSDDMGYSDIGCYVSEIHTPNLNMLAKEGLRYTQFYNTSRCCPSRASLMTGLYPAIGSFLLQFWNRAYQLKL